MTVALVTGAASGIGAALCRRLARPGLAILVHTRKNLAGAELVAGAVRRAGGEAEVRLADLAEPEASARLVGETMAAFGGLDWLVSNAGAADRRRFADLPEAGVTPGLLAMTEAFFRLARAARPHLLGSTEGRVVAVSSFVAHRFPFDGDLFPATAAAKAGLEALARAYAAEMAPAGVTVNIVAPGYTSKDPGTHTAITPERWAAIGQTIPLGRAGLPEDVAAVIQFLLGPDAGYVTGQTIHVDGGLGLR